jgi:type VI secretion system protein ImpG
MFLFGSILNEFLPLYASLNSFSQLSLKEVQRGEIFQWDPRMGQQTLV